MGDVDGKHEDEGGAGLVECREWQRDHEQQRGDAEADLEDEHREQHVATVLGARGHLRSTTELPPQHRDQEVERWQPAFPSFTTNTNEE